MDSRPFLFFIFFLFSAFFFSRSGLYTTNYIWVERPSNKACLHWRQTAFGSHFLFL